MLDLLSYGLILVLALVVGVVILLVGADDGWR